MVLPTTKIGPAPARPALWVVIAATTFFRLVLNTARRFAYPFAPVLSRGLGVSLTAVTSLIAVNQITGVLGVLFGLLADRWGYRRVMRLALLLLGAGMLLGGLFPTYAMIMVALFLAGLAKSIFDPAIQAYVGRRVPFARRALAIGAIEFSWAGSTLLGIPLTALCIEEFGWRAPFFIMGGLGVLGFFVWSRVISDDVPPNRASGALPGLKEAIGQLVRKPPALGALGYAFFISMANDNLFVVYGAWLEKSFGLSILALGVGTSVIGVAELTGEGITAFFADRLGIQRSVMIGAGLTIGSYALLAIFGTSLPLAVAGLFLVFLTFELTIVASLSLCTEILPEFRATMMSTFLAGAGMGRVVGTLMGGPVWLAGGIRAVGLLSAAITFLALVSLNWGLRRWHR
jgi:MFS transporter, DHA1 family, inner membrane transport protein